MRYRIILLIGVVLIAILFIFNPFKKTVEVPVAEENTTVVKNELPAQEGLPPVVEAKRQAIYKATLTRDYNKLASEADATLHYSFGGAYEGGFAGYMKLAEKDEGQSAFDIIPVLLRLPYSVNSNSISGDMYTWPSVFTIEPSKWTVEDIKLMETFLTKEQIESYREYGGYIYYRLGITSDGKWTFYLAGD